MLYIDFNHKSKFVQSLTYRLNYSEFGQINYLAKKKAYKTELHLTIKATKGSHNCSEFMRTNRFNYSKFGQSNNLKCTKRQRSEMYQMY